MTTTAVRGYVFDAYGTLFDVHSVVEVGREITDDPMALSAIWRQKQLEYTWLRSLMGRYEDFWLVTGQALRFALRRHGVAAGEAQIEALMNAYLALSPFPEVPAALRALRGTPLAILSNGSPHMLESAVRSSMLTGAFDHVLSVDAVGVYKPSPRVYELAPRALGLTPGEIVFVSSNGWDVAGAAAYGFTTCWCNRANAPAEELDMTPDYEVDRLDAIPGKLGL
jgi:2-haloacid dehalogenase